MSTLFEKSLPDVVVVRLVNRSLRGHSRHIHLSPPRNLKPESTIEIWRLVLSPETGTPRSRSILGNCFSTTPVVPSVNENGDVDGTADPAQLRRTRVDGAQRKMVSLLYAHAAEKAWRVRVTDYPTGFVLPALATG